MRGAYLIASRHLQVQSGLGSSDIVAVRFLLTVFVCFFYANFQYQTILIPFDAFLIFGLIALIGSIAPLYLIQKSAETIGPTATGLFMPFMPPFCGVLAFFILPGSITFAHAAAALAVFFAMSGRAVRFYRRKGGASKIDAG